MEETYLRAKQSVVQDQARMLEAATRKRKAVVDSSEDEDAGVEFNGGAKDDTPKASAAKKSRVISDSDDE